MNSITRLQEWYAENCDGDWEHTFGVQIDTLDNPGWSVTVDLAGTVLQDRIFEEMRRDTSEVDWLICKVTDMRFVGSCGVRNLDELLNSFLAWANA